MDLINAEEPVYTFVDAPKASEPKKLPVIHEEIEWSYAPDYVQLIRQNGQQQSRIEQLENELKIAKEELQNMQIHVIQVQANCTNQLRYISQTCEGPQRRALLYEAHLLTTAIFRALKIFQ